jgi:hypothetical protein
MRYLSADFVLSLRTELICHGKGLRNRQKESIESCGFTTTGSAGCKATGDVLVLSSAAVDGHGSCGDDGGDDSSTCAPDAEAE